MDAWSCMVAWHGMFVAFLDLHDCMDACSCMVAWHGMFGLA